MTSRDPLCYLVPKGCTSKPQLEEKEWSWKMEASSMEAIVYLLFVTIFAHFALRHDTLLLYLAVPACVYTLYHVIRRPAITVLKKDN